MGAMTVLWSFLGVLKHLLAPPFALPMFITIKKIIILHLFLGVPAATVGGTGTPWHTRGYAPVSNILIFVINFWPAEWNNVLFLVVGRYRR